MTLSHAATHHNDTSAASFASSFRSAVSVMLPGPVDHYLYFTVGLRLFDCPPLRRCDGPNGTVLTANMNNVSFQLQTRLSIQEIYHRLPGVFTAEFPASPPV
ncbi:hypothetical protein ZIOFF_023297 [Zingiber officinale]|uniref:Uncharacterized protein n=1 Tax=Zingiber officinale TaxID=94328 RepID=A0A8J5H6E3_ZINOF|nr:hypothetical protein ZIOFF_023297 [Zingiber officinale]